VAPGWAARSGGEQQPCPQAGSLSDCGADGKLSELGATRILSISEWIKKHQTRHLIRIETLDRYDMASDDDDFHRYVRGEATPRWRSGATRSATGVVLCLLAPEAMRAVRAAVDNSDAVPTVVG
jgi:hypothetical protein